MEAPWQYAGGFFFARNLWFCCRDAIASRLYNLKLALVIYILLVSRDI